MAIRSTPSSRLVGSQYSRFPPSSRRTRSGHPAGSRSQVEREPLRCCGCAQRYRELSGLLPDLAPLGDGELDGALPRSRP